MNEKRFTKDIQCFVIPCFYDKGKHITPKEVVELLNMLHEENIELVTKCNELQKENEQLKQSLDRSRERVKRQSKDLEKYYEYFTRELNWDCERIMKEVFRW